MTKYLQVWYNIFIKLRRCFIIVYKESDQINFGLYSGKTIQWIRINDLDYLKQLSHSVQWFNLHIPIPMEYLFDINDTITNGSSILKILTLRQGGGYKAQYVDSNTITVITKSKEKYYKIIGG